MKAALSIAVTGLVLVLGGCSGDEPITGSGGAAGAAATTGPAPLPEPSGLTPGYEGSPQPESTKRVLPDIDSKTTATFDIGAGTSATKKRFSPLVDTLGGVRADVEFFRASTASKPAADIAVFTFDAAQAKSEMFQGQIVSQLVTTAAGAKKASYDTIKGQTFTVAGKDTKAIGVFSGDSAVIVLGASGSKSLDLASGATFAYLAR